MRHLAVPYIVQGVHAIMRFVPIQPGLSAHAWPLVQTLNLDWADLTPLFPNYSSFISAPIIPKEIPK